MFYAGLDLGQRRDYSAIAIVERKELMRAFQTPLFQGLLVRHVERIPLGTPYPRVVARVRDIVRSAELRGQCALAADGTGVGAPVVEMLRAAELGCEITAVTITSGEREHSCSWAGGAAWNVPKQDLIAGVQVLLERGELKIARRLRDAGPLVRELLDVRATPGRVGRMRWGAEGCGEHDDLVIALALACWRAGRKRSGMGVRRLPGI
jgi:hypothetical protein